MSKRNLRPVMLKSPFARGLLLGVFVGFVVEYLVVAALPPMPGSDSGEAERLRHQLEIAHREREGLEQNLEEFRQVADKMTAAFNDLERRFQGLEERLAKGESAQSSGATPGQ